MDLGQLHESGLEGGRKDDDINRNHTTCHRTAVHFGAWNFPAGIHSFCMPLAGLVHDLNSNFVQESCGQLVATASFGAVSHAILFHRDRPILDVDRVAEVAARIDSVVLQLLFDTEDLVELGQTLGASRGTGFLALRSA